MITVKNLNGTSRNKCNCGSWLQHWRKLSGSFTVGCSNANCWGSAEVGAHVQKKYGTDNGWYIVPLCKSCNGKSDNFNVGLLTTFVSANVAKSCRKPINFFSW